MSSDEKMQILKMLEEGKITSEEADKLITALEDIDLLASESNGDAGGPLSINLGEISEDLGELREELKGLKELKRLKGLGAIIRNMGFGDEPTATESIDWASDGDLKLLRIKNTNGKVNLKAGDKTELTITKKIYGREEGAEEKLSKIEVLSSQDGDEAAIEVKSHFGPFRGRYIVDIEGTVNPGCTLDVKQSNGKIVTEGIHKLDADFSNGKVESDAVELGIDMSNGKVRAKAPGKFTVDGSNGKVIVESIDNLTNLDVDMSNGKLDLAGGAIPAAVNYKVNMTNGKFIFDLEKKPDNVVIDFKKVNGKVSGPLEFVKEEKHYVYRSGEPEGNIKIKVVNGKLVFDIAEMEG
ncbi:MAG: DUF4097 domain-containing protein [bacterium]|nr:DUF4097 domain-containing protein [bacterium]